MSNYITLGPDTPKGRYRIASTDVADTHRTKFNGYVGVLLDDNGHFLFDGETESNCILYGAILEPLDEPFVPKVGEIYYIPEFTGDRLTFVVFENEYMLKIDEDEIASGLCRRTAEECQTICDELNAVLDKHRRK